MSDTMNTITFVVFSLIIISVKDMIKEIPHVFFKVQLRMNRVSPSQLPSPLQAQS